MEYILSLVWFGLIILFVLAEAAGPELISIWFAGGALITLVVSFFSVPFWIQLLVFVVSSALLLISTRPLVKRKLMSKTIKTNSDSLIGQIGIVTSPINNKEGVGLVKIAGQIWSARSIDGSDIPEGENVLVERIDGVKLMVKK